MKNKNFIIIGASGGIGTRLVADLSSDHCGLLLGFHNESSNHNDYPIIKSAQLDCSSFEETLSFITDCKDKVDHIHGIVALPGSITLRPPHLVSDRDFEHTININLKSAFSVVRSAGKLLSDSSIVLMSTAAVSIGLANHELIVAAKAGVESMVKSASQTYAKKSLRFNAVAPGLVDTPLSSRIVNNPAALQVSEKMHAAGRIGKTQDVSQMIRFLLNPSNNWITGQTFYVDGGLSSTKA